MSKVNQREIDEALYEQRLIEEGALRPMYEDNKKEDWIDYKTRMYDDKRRAEIEKLLYDEDLSFDWLDDFDPETDEDEFIEWDEEFDCEE